MPGRNFSSEDYRYGFQRQEKDDEIMGSGNSINYKYRMHDPRLSRFFAVDPLAASFPWNSPYAFSENRVIASIELEGLEAVDLNTNNNVNEPYTSQQSMDATNDVAPWSDLINFKPSSTDVNNAGNRVFGTPEVQNIEDGNGQLNVDYYSVTISGLPDGVSSGGALLNYFRSNLNSFTNGNTSFGAYNEGEGKRFLANENSALMSFQVLLGGFFNVDDLSVMQSKNSSNYWVFSTMTTFRDGGHPVSGNRQFGVTTNNNGTYTFFTRGADRPNTMLDKASSSLIFEGADELWQAVMTNMVNYINDNGGNAERNVTFSKQTDW